MCRTARYTAWLNKATHSNRKPASSRRLCHQAHMQFHRPLSVKRTGLLVRSWQRQRSRRSLYMGLYDSAPPQLIHYANLSFLTLPPGQVAAVEFFVGWCGHCQAFSPTWKALATGACAAPALRIAVVDCVAHRATICQTLQIGAYPTIRLFGAGFDKNGTPLPKCEHGCTSPEEVLQDVLNAAALRGADIGVTIGTSARVLLSRSQRHACGRDGPPPVRSGTVAGGVTEGPRAPPELFVRPRYMEDVVGAVIYGLQHELFARPSPPGSRRRAAMLAWLDLLHSALPGSANRAAILRVRAAALRAVDGDAEALSVATRPVLPEGGAGGITWRACQGWSADSRGYPCGLWSLFHTLLAHADEPADAILGIQQYVQHFFGCQSCASHFLRMARDGISQRAADRAPDGVHAPAASSAASASLWLWRAHNAVNARINASSEKAVLALGLRKLQWPDTTACPLCRSASGHWRRGQVVNFLANEYCHPKLSVCTLQEAAAVEAKSALDDSIAGADAVLPASQSLAMPGMAGALLLLPPWLAASASAVLLLAVVAITCHRSSTSLRGCPLGTRRLTPAVFHLAGDQQQTSSYRGLPGTESDE
jgi:hypothetical protein